VPERSDPRWREVLLALLGAWPGRLDEMTATAWLHEVQARGGRDPEAVLQALRAIGGDHPPSAPAVAQIVLRDGQADPPGFDAVVTFVAQTIATRTRSGDDALSGFVAFIAAECHEAAARWVADLGIAALREVPDPRYPLDQGQRIRLRDHEKAYREHCEAWRQSPMRHVAVEHARQIDERAGYELPRLHAVPEIGPGA
jgi:hypothetical protein